MAEMLPPGVSVDIGAPKESSFDKLLKLVEAGRGIGQAVQQIRQTRETNNVQALTLISGLVDNATSSADIEQIQNIYNQNFDDTHFSSNPAYNTLVDVSQMNMEKKSNKISDFETSSQEFANTLYSTDNLFNTNLLNLDAEQLEKVFKEKSIDETKGWIKPAMDARDGIVMYKDNLREIYKDKNPNFQINVNGQKRSIKQVMMDLDRYDQIIDGLTMKALDDGVLSPQEAQQLARIRPSQGYVSQQFKTFIDGKRQAAKTMFNDSQTYIFSKALANVKKALSSQDTDIRAQSAAFMDVFNEEGTRDMATNRIPNLSETKIQLPDGTTKTLPAITNATTDEDKINHLMQHIEAGQVDINTLNDFTEVIIGEGNRMRQQALKMFDAYGGKEDVFGLDEEGTQTTKFFTDEEILKKDDGEDGAAASMKIDLSQTEKQLDSEEIDSRSKKTRDLGYEIIEEPSVTIDMDLLKKMPQLEPLKHHQLTGYDKNLVFKKLTGANRFRARRDDRTAVQIFNSLSIKEQSEILNKNLKKHSYSKYKEYELKGRFNKK